MTHPTTYCLLFKVRTRTALSRVALEGLREALRQPKATPDLEADAGSWLKESGIRSSSIARWLMTTTQVNPGANFEIVVDAKPGSYRDDQKIAVEAAQYLKLKNPNVEVAVRDIRTGEVTPIHWTPPEVSAAPTGKRH